MSGWWREAGRAFAPARSPRLVRSGLLMMALGTVMAFARGWLQLVLVVAIPLTALVLFLDARRLLREIDDNDRRRARDDARPREEER